MIDVMIDTETMGTGPDGALMSIGAVFFDEASGQLGAEFYRNIHLATAVNAGAEMDASTVLWWLSQPDEARLALRMSAEPIGDVLTALANWLRQHGPGDADLRVWGNSPSFDCVKVERAMTRLGMTVPWRYYNERCYRTVRERAPSVELDERQGLHNALEDAKYQARHLLKIAGVRRARTPATHQA